MRLALLVLLVPTAAVASPNDLDPHVNAGLEIMLADGTLLAARVHAGASFAVGDGHTRPSFAIGGTLGGGWLEQGMAHPSYVDAGPELQVGLRIGDDWINNRVFAGVAYLPATWIDNKRAGAATRVSIGGNVAGLAHELWDATQRGFLLVVLPQQIELAWSHEASGNRFGVTFAYGL